MNKYLNAIETLKNSNDHALRCEAADTLNDLVHEYTKLYRANHGLKTTIAHLEQKLIKQVDYYNGSKRR